MLTTLVRAGALALFFVPAVAAAESCSFSDLDCAKDGKCNIHFENRTGIKESNCHKDDSYSNAITATVEAKDDSGNTLGNRLNITAGQKDTMNLSNSAKASVSSIKVRKDGNFEGTEFGCDAIRTILSGSGKCKVYINREGYNDIAPFGYQFFDCDGGKVCTTGK